ncbi:hypothetical protein D8B26_004432 [Coccidioides posadasii str. Silveira]|uniref:Uncharacterized protein n=1 Tax=Coccidioides posadasii (strain RMSCC 757 / Silveira) TaxID=443226 RepID=E9DC20_COCPS|nr:hypothetical protein CPSG_07372 [Coccidioides posadasii str. Silveira]QVM09773.1 hypothetical protein D8B26_004432 [Coccidioides posadasii str. Silveira]
MCAARKSHHGGACYSGFWRNTQSLYVALGASAHSLHSLRGRTDRRESLRFLSLSRMLTRPSPPEMRPGRQKPGVIRQSSSIMTSKLDMSRAATLHHGLPGPVSRLHPTPKGVR